MLRLEQRQKASTLMRWITPPLAVLLTIILGGILYWLLGKDPVEAIRIIFIEPMTLEYSRSQLFVKASPLILIALGLSFCFRSNVWNIGAEGQFVMGALAGGAVGLALYPAQGIWVLPLMAIASILGGFAWAMIPALLKIRWNANEILVSLMLVYIAYNFLAAMVTGPMRNPEGFNFPESRNFHEVIICYFLLQKHIIGFQIKVNGISPKAVDFDLKRSISQALVKNSSLFFVWVYLVH